MSKLTNVKGRIDYISSPKRQENLYAVFETTERKFWEELAKCNQMEFKKSGTDGKCIEARELIIALPESFVGYDPNVLLQIFTKHFKNIYRMECIAALHHNKQKTNYHIHLIFSERRRLLEPKEKIATRNMFYDENGKHVRTKKEILDKVGQIRKGCKVIRKGEVYERNIFTTKYAYFKGEEFLNEVKEIYTNLINFYVKDEKERQKVFDKNGIYLPMKKIGKNNPKAQQIKEDNWVRENWNRTVDRALIVGVLEEEILKVKQEEIQQKVKKSIQQFGNYPFLFRNIITHADIVLSTLINKKYKIALEEINKTENHEINLETDKIEAESEKNVDVSAQEIHLLKTPEPVLEKPFQSELAFIYPKLSEVYDKLQEQNKAIYQKEDQLVDLEKEITMVKGIFQAKRRRELREKAEYLKTQIENMKQHLSTIVLNYGYKNMQEFMTEYKIAKIEYNQYEMDFFKWEQEMEHREMEKLIAEEFQKQKVEKKELKGRMY